MLKPLSSSFLKFLTLMVAFVATIFVFESSARADTPDGQFRTVTLDAAGDKVVDGVAVEVGSGVGIETLIKAFGSMYASSAGKPLTWEVIQARNPANTFPTCKVEGDGYRAGRTGDTTVWEGCPMEARSIALMAGFSGRVVIPMKSIETYAERQARLAELEACDASIDCLSKKIIAKGGTPPAPAAGPAPVNDVDVLQDTVIALEKENTVLTSDKKTLTAANLTLRSELDNSRFSLYAIAGLMTLGIGFAFAAGRFTAKRHQSVEKTTALALVDPVETKAIEEKTTVRNGKLRSPLSLEEQKREEMKQAARQAEAVQASEQRLSELRHEIEQLTSQKETLDRAVRNQSVVIHGSTVQINLGHASQPVDPRAPTQHGVTSSPVSHNGVNDVQMFEKMLEVFMERLHRSLEKGPSDHAQRALLAKPMESLAAAILAARAAYIPDLTYKLPPMNPPPHKLLPPEEEEKTREIQVDALRKEALLEAPPDSPPRKTTLRGINVPIPREAHDDSKEVEAFREEVTHDESAGDRLTLERETVPHPDSQRLASSDEVAKSEKWKKRAQKTVSLMLTKRARDRNRIRDLQRELHEANAREEALLPNAEDAGKLKELELRTIPSMRGQEAAYRIKIRALELEVKEANQGTRALQEKQEKERATFNAAWKSHIALQHSIKDKVSSGAFDGLSDMQAKLRPSLMFASRTLSALTGGISLHMLMNGNAEASAEVTPVSLRAPRVPSSSDQSQLGGGHTNPNFPPVASRSLTPAYGTKVVRDVVDHLNGSTESGRCWTMIDLEKTLVLKRAIEADSPAILVVGRDTLGTFSSFLQHPAVLSADLLRGQPANTIAELTETPQGLETLLQQAAMMGLLSVRSSFLKTLAPPGVPSPLADAQLSLPAADEDEDSRGPSA